MNKKRIIKSIILPDEIEKCWGFTQHENRYICLDCGSLLFYIQRVMAVTYDVTDYQISGYKDKGCYSLSECGLKVYCAECGRFQEIYFYDKVKIVCEFDELDNAEKEEIDYCLAQYNQRREYVPRFKNPSVEILKEKLKEYENRCGHKWVPRGDEIPQICPKCKNPYWAKPKTRFLKSKRGKK